MKITKPSELREGMRVKFRSNSLDFWGWAYKCDDGDWQVVGGTGTGYVLSSRESPFRSIITDVESYEGLMAMKEGDVLEHSDGSLSKVVFCNEYIFGRRYIGSNDVHFDTYDTAKRYGWKLKDQEQLSESPAIITSNELEIQRKVFTEIEDELLKHKFTTDMSGWEIVPQLMATMQILRSKYFGGKRVIDSSKSITEEELNELIKQQDAEDAMNCYYDNETEKQI